MDEGSIVYLESKPTEFQIDLYEFVLQQFKDALHHSHQQSFALGHLVSELETQVQQLKANCENAQRGRA